MSTIKQDLIRVRALKREAERAGRVKRAADSAFKMQQARVVERLQEEDIDSMQTDGTLFSLVTKVKGNVTDRKAYLRWCLDQDEGVQEFLVEMIEAVEGPGTFPAPLIERFYDTLLSLTACDLRENTANLNEQANLHLDDGVPLPPGLDFRPDAYISHRKAAKRRHDDAA